MIRIVTLSDSNKKFDSTARLREWTEQLRTAEIDVLCCQGIQRTLDGKKDPVRTIAESLEMTYSFSATGYGVSDGRGEKEIAISGLSILAGAHVWILNSGSFVLPGENTGKKQVAQFAIIRQNGNSLLVINAELSPTASVQLQQLRAVFSHQLLQEHYGAVVLCSNGNIAVSPRDLQSVTALSAYKIANETMAMAFGKNKHSTAASSSKRSNTGQPVEGMIFTLTARMLAPTAVKIHGPSAALQLSSVLATEFEFKRFPPEKRNKFFFPLSFSEQRLEPKGNHRGFAVSAS